MSEGQSSAPSWLIILFLVLGVVAAVIIALLLAQIDTFQRRSSVPSNGPAITDLEATIAAGDLSTIYLQGEVEATPTTPVYPTTPTITSTPAELVPKTPTAIVETSCGQQPNTGTVYIVRSGDTLESIARYSRLSEEAIRLANCLAHDRLIQGQQLYLPVTSEVVAPSDPPCGGMHNWKRYKIAPGDTLPKLARTYGTSVYHIMKANCLDNPELAVAGEIILPDISQGQLIPYSDN